MSQKFVPLISCTIIFDQNLFLHEISRRCLFLYREHMFRISVTGMPFLFFLSHSVAVAAWCGTRRVDPQMIHFELFYHLVRRSQFNPQTMSFKFRQLKIYILGIHPKKIIIPAPFHSKAFVLLYKFETSWALIGRLSRGFFAISGASNFKHFKQLFTTLLFGLLTM